MSARSLLLILLGLSGCASATGDLDASSSLDAMPLADAASAADAADAGSPNADAGTSSSCSDQTIQAASIPTRDGKSLAAWVRAPSDPSCHLPAILIQTPYNKDGVRTAWLESNMPQPLFDSKAYAVVVVDWRGFFGSTAAALPNPPQPYGQDGYDSVEWIAAQPWSNGRVGTYGVSALCVQQFRTAVLRPPHLIAAVPIFCELNMDYPQLYPGGVLREEYASFLGSYFGVDFYRQHPYEDSLWRGAARALDPATIAVPMLIVAGWFDLFPVGSFRTFDALVNNGDAAARAQHRLLIGPWVHFATGGEGRSAQPPIDPTYLDGEKRIQTDALAFFEHHLRQAPSDAATWPAVRYLPGAESAWESSDHWPPAGPAPRSYYLAAGDRLAEVAPATSATAAIPYDPADPSPTIGGATLLPTLVHGPTSQARVLARTDARAFTTAVLPAPLRVRGAISLELSASTSGADTDLAVRLTDVGPNGDHLLIAEGIRRLKLRDSYTTPALPVAGQRYTVSIFFTSELAYTFASGHQVGLIVSGSNYPRFAKNPGTGADFLMMGETGTALVDTIYLDGVSKLTLPVE